MSAVRSGHSVCLLSWLRKIHILPTEGPKVVTLEKCHPRWTVLTKPTWLCHCFRGHKYFLRILAQSKQFEERCSALNYIPQFFTCSLFYQPSSWLMLCFIDPGSIKGIVDDRATWTQNVITLRKYHQIILSDEVNEWAKLSTFRIVNKLSFYKHKAGNLGGEGG